MDSVVVVAAVHFNYKSHLKPKKLIIIIIYLLPILLSSVLTKKISYFLLSAGIMNFILGLSIKLIPGIIGYKSQKHSNNLNYIFIIISGLCLIIASMQV